MWDLPIYFRAFVPQTVLARWGSYVQSKGNWMLTATARVAVGRGLGFDAPAVVSREFRCVSMLPLWFRANSAAFRCSRCGFARIPVSRGLFRPLLVGPLRLPTATSRTVGRVLGFDAPAVVSREFRPRGALVSTLPVWFRTNSGLAWPLQASRGGTGPWFRRSRCGFARIPASRGLGFDAPGVVSREFWPLQASSGLARWDGSLVSTLPLWFRANSGLAEPWFRCSHCGFARILASSGLFWEGHLGCRPQGRARWDGSLFSTLPLWFRANSGAFRCSRYGFARIPASRGLGFDAPAVVSREIRCVSMFPLWFRVNSGAFRCSHCGFARRFREFRPLLACTRWGGAFVSAYIPELLAGFSCLVRPLYSWRIGIASRVSRILNGGLGGCDTLEKFHTCAKPNPPTVGVLLTPKGIRPPRTFVLFVPGSVGALLAFFGLFWPSSLLGSTPA